MKNRAQSPEKLRESILNIVDHYQVSQNHSILCAPLTQAILFQRTYTQIACRRPGYKPSKLRLTSPAAIEAYKKTLQATLICKNAESYCRVGVRFLTLIVVQHMHN